MAEQHIDEVPWTLQQTFFGIFITLIPWLVIVVGITGLTGASTATTPVPSPQHDLLNAIAVFFISSVIEGAFLLAPLYYANRAFRSIIPHLRLALHALGFRTFKAGYAFLLIIVLLLLIIAVDNLYQYLITTLHLHLQTNDQVLLAQSKKAPFTTYATLLAAVFVAPLCEEIFFRGFVFMGLRHAMPVGWAIVFSALIFAIAHGDPGSFAVLFIIGLALAFLRWHTHSLWPGIILHMLNNGLGAVAIILAMHGIG